MWLVQVQAFYRHLTQREAGVIDLVVSKTVFSKFLSDSNWQKKHFIDGAFYLTYRDYEINLD